MNNSKPPEGEKLQKVLAREGHGSRREMEQWISEGRVRVGDHVAILGERVGPDVEVRIDNRRIELHGSAPRRVLLYHKPVGEICTRSDEAGRATIFDKLPNARGGRWIAVGRLDLNTSGLILLTTDGELANRLMHPSSEIEREYAVRIHGRVDEGVLQRLRDGVELEDGKAAFEQIEDRGGEGSNHWYHVILREGRRREVRRLWESQGVQVSRLVRVRYGPVALPRGVRAGSFEQLAPQQVDLLLEAVGMALPERKPTAPRKGKGGGDRHKSVAKGKGGGDQHKPVTRGKGGAKARHGAAPRRR